MMEINSLIIELRKEINNKELFKFYLFGSARFSDRPNDIDILVVYKKSYSLEGIIDLRNKIEDIVFSIYNIHADVILLSKCEALYNTFINDEKCILLNV